MVTRWSPPPFRPYSRSSTPLQTSAKPAVAVDESAKRKQRELYIGNLAVGVTTGAD